MAFSIAWDTTGFTVRMPLGEPGQWKTMFNPDIKEVIATIIAPLVLAAGLGAIWASIRLLVLKSLVKVVELSPGQNRVLRRLVIINLGPGLFIAAGAYLVTLWGFPTSYTFPDVLSPDTGLVTLGQHFFIPNRKFTIAHELVGLVCLLGVIYLIFSLLNFRSILVLNRKGESENV